MIAPPSAKCSLRAAPAFVRALLRRSGTGDSRSWVLVLERASVASAGLDGFHDLLAGGVRDLAKDDVLPVKPAGDNGGDEELATVGVRAGVGHGKKVGLLVRELEVLVGKLFTVDGFAAGSLWGLC